MVSEVIGEFVEQSKWVPKAKGGGKTDGIFVPCLASQQVKVSCAGQGCGWQHYGTTDCSDDFRNF